MSIVSRGLLFACAGILAGCSIHPLPEDVTGNTTAAIVRKIRCEARGAVVESALRYLNQHGISYTEADLRTLNVKKLPASFGPQVSKNVTYFAQTGIVYSFSLAGTESGGLTAASADIIRPLAHGTETLTPSIGDTVSRNNIRAFSISDNFRSLVQDVKPDYCNFEAPGPNYQYPIVGRIGIDEMVKTFIRLTLFDDLGGTQDVAKNGYPTSNGPPTMVDSITFTTTISAGLTPKIMLTTVGKSWQLMDGSLPFSAMRMDQHEVIVGLALPAIQGPAPNLNHALTSLVISTAPSSSGEAIAAQAVAQQIIRFQLPTPLIVAQ